MLINEEARTKLVQKIEDNINQLLSQSSINVIKFILNSAFSSEYCYFCVLHNYNCDICEYGAIHGICTKYPSDFRDICEIIKETFEEADMVSIKIDNISLEIKNVTHEFIENILSANDVDDIMLAKVNYIKAVIKIILNELKIKEIYESLVNKIIPKYYVKDEFKK